MEELLGWPLTWEPKVSFFFLLDFIWGLLWIIDTFWFFFSGYGAGRFQGMWPQGSNILNMRCKNFDQFTSKWSHFWECKKLPSYHSIGPYFLIFPKYRNAFYCCRLWSPFWAHQQTSNARQRYASLQNYDRRCSPTVFWCQKFSLQATDLTSAHLLDEEIKAMVILDDERDFGGRLLSFMKTLDVSRLRRSCCRSPNWNQRPDEGCVIGFEQLMPCVWSK